MLTMSSVAEILNDLRACFKPLAVVILLCLKLSSTLRSSLDRRGFLKLIHVMFTG
jgi:hypothetical protein